jgi:hypothetical protein
MRSYDSCVAVFQGLNLPLFLHSDRGIPEGIRAMARPVVDWVALKLTRPRVFFPAVVLQALDALLAMLGVDPATLQEHARGLDPVM